MGSTQFNTEYITQHVVQVKIHKKASNDKKKSLITLTLKHILYMYLCIKHHTITKIKSRHFLFHFLMIFVGDCFIAKIKNSHIYKFLLFSAQNKRPQMKGDENNNKNNKNYYRKEAFLARAKWMENDMLYNICLFAERNFWGKNSILSHLWLVFCIRQNKYKHKKFFIIIISLLFL